MRCTKLEPGGVSPTYPTPPALLWELGVRLAPRGAAWWFFFFFFWSPAGTPQRFAVVRGSRRMSSRHNKRTCPRRADPDLAWARRWERGGSLGPLVPIPRPSQGGLLSALSRGLLRRLRIVLEMSGSGAVPPPRSGLCSGMAWSSPAWWESPPCSLCLGPEAQSPGAGQELQALGGCKSACLCLQGAHSASLGMATGSLTSRRLPSPRGAWPG